MLISACCHCGLSYNHVQFAGLLFWLGVYVCVLVLSQEAFCSRDCLSVTEHTIPQKSMRGISLIVVTDVCAFVDVLITFGFWIKCQGQSRQ